MADRYWVGGTGTWNTTNTTNWSTTSGGGGSASVPTVNDRVIIDSNSGTGAITITMAGTLNTGGFRYFVKSGTSITLTPGSVSWTNSGEFTETSSSPGTFSCTVPISFAGSGSYNISIPKTSQVFESNWTFTSGTYTLLTNLTLGVTRTWNFTSGTFNINGFTLQTGLFASTGTLARTINWGSTGLVITTLAATGTAFDFNSPTNLTITGSKNVTCQGGGGTITKTVNCGNFAENGPNITLADTSATVTYTMTGHMNDFNMTGTQIVGGTSARVYGNWNHATTNTTFVTGAIYALFGPTTPATKNFTMQTATTPTMTISLNNSGSWRQVNSVAGSIAVTHNSGTWDFNNKAWTGGNWAVNNTAQCTWINTGGSSLSLNCNFALNAGTFTFPSNVTLSGTNNNSLTLSAGTLDFAGYTITACVFINTGTNVRTLAFGSTGKLVLNRTGTNTLITSNASNFTCTGNRLIECIGGGGGTKTITGIGTMTEANALSLSLIDSTATTYSIDASTRINNLIINGPITINNVDWFIYGDFTHLTSLGSPTLVAGAGIWRFVASSGTKTLNLQNNFNYDFNMLFGLSGTTATWRIVNNFQMGTGTTRTLTLQFGTLDFQNYSLITGGMFQYQNGDNASLLNTGGSTLSVANYNYQNGTHTSSYAISCSGNFYVQAGSFTLGGNLTALGFVQLVAGTLNLNNYNITTAQFTSSNSNTRTVNFGTTGKFILSRNTAGTLWSTNTQTGFTLLGTPVADCLGGGGITKTLDPGNATENNCMSFNIIDSGATYAMVGPAAVKNFVLNGTQTINNPTGTLTIWGTMSHLTANGTTTFGAGSAGFVFSATSGSYTVTTQSSATYDFPMTFGTAGTTASWTLTSALTLGTNRILTLTAGTLVLGGNVSTGGFASNNSNTRELNYGNFKFILTAASALQAWTTATLTGLTLTGTGRLLVEGLGGAFNKNIATGPADETNALDFSLLATGGGTWIFAAGNAVRNLIINGFQTVNNVAITIYGNYTHSTGNGTTTFNSGTNAWTFASTQAAQTITAGAVTHDFPWIFNAGTSTVYTLQSAITIGSARKLTFTNGRINMNGFTLTTGFFENSAGAQTLTFNGGTLAVSGVGTTSPNFPFYITDTGAITLTPGTGTATISMTGGTAKSFVHNGKSFTGIKLNQGGAGNLDITGSTTWGDLTSTISATSTGNIRFDNGSTQTFERFNLVGLGTAANRPQLISSTTNGTVTIVGTPDVNGFVYGASNIVATGINFTPYTLNSFLRWYIGSTSQVNNCTGALVLDYVLGTSSKVYVLEPTAGTSWVVPADFNHTSNTIYLFGAGGNGVNGGNGGEGGGGGGYTRGDNIDLRSVYAASCYIPNGGDSTACTFHTLSAGSASGRIGGTGSNANGGNGGTSPWFPVTPIIGGSGGGAGGPWGNGANGVNGTTVTANTNRGGHGGGGAAGGVAGQSSGAGTNGGNGGAASSNAGTGTAGTGGSLTVSATWGVRGGGGGGAGTRAPGVNLFQDTAGAGGNGIDILSCLGAGGGGGSGGTTNDANWTGVGVNGASGGRYGGGGGGGGYGGNFYGGAGGGGSGAVIIVYVPVPVNRFFGLMT